MKEKPQKNISEIEDKYKKWNWTERVWSKEIMPGLNSLWNIYVTSIRVSDLIIFFRLKEIFKFFLKKKKVLRKILWNWKRKSLTARVAHIPFAHMVKFNFLIIPIGSPSSLSHDNSIIIIIIYSLRVFYNNVSRWSFTGVWLTASLLNSPGLFTVIWPISIMLLFGWSPLVLLIPSPPVSFIILWRL